MTELIVELTRVEEAVRATPTFRHHADQRPELCPELLDLLHQEVAIVSELRRRGTSWQAATVPAWWAPAEVGV